MKETCEEELAELKEILRREFPSLKKTITRNLACLIFALILLLRTYRRWYGRLTLSGVARYLPTEGTGRSRYKRLTRFLDNGNFQIINLSEDLIHLIYKEEGFLPVIIDQTAIGDVQDNLKRMFQRKEEVFPLLSLPLNTEKLKLAKTAWKRNS